jgi:hypothetical protein
MLHFTLDSFGQYVPSFLIHAIYTNALVLAIPLTLND